ncbi:MAG: anti-sigma factor [Cellulosilyticaceae bacterium]
MNCETCLSKMSLYIDQDLSQEEVKLMEEHIAICPSCKEEYEVLKMMISQLGEIEDEPLPEGFHINLMDKINAIPLSTPTKEKLKSPYKKWIHYASGAAALLFVGIVLTNYAPPTNLIANSQEKAISDQSYALQQGEKLETPEVEGAGIEIPGESSLEDSKVATAQSVESPMPTAENKQEKAMRKDTNLVAPANNSPKAASKGVLKAEPTAIPKAESKAIPKAEPKAEARSKTTPTNAPTKNVLDSAAVAPSPRDNAVKSNESSAPMNIKGKMLLDMTEEWHLTTADSKTLQSYIEELGKKQGVTVANSGEGNSFQINFENKALKQEFLLHLQEHEGVKACDVANTDENNLMVTITLE